MFLLHESSLCLFSFSGIAKSYSMFRIFQTGMNSNGHAYLALSGFEIYGSVWSFRKKM